MIEQRKFPRIRFDAQCALLHEGCSHEGNVVNISLGGAMLSLDDAAIIPQGDKCRCIIFSENGQRDEIEATVVYSTFSCIGIMFLNFNRNTHPLLFETIERLSSNPDKYRVSYP